MENTCEELYYRYADTIYRMAFVMMKNAEDAEDAVSEAFIRYLQKKPDFSTPEYEKAWLLRVTINYCKDQLKKRKYPLENIEMIPDCPMEEKDREVIGAVLSLPKKYRQAVYLYYYEGYTVREISRMMKTRESTMQSRLSKARELLRKRLEV